MPPGLPFPGLREVAEHKALQFGRDGFSVSVDAADVVEVRYQFPQYWERACPRPIGCGPIEAFVAPRGAVRLLLVSACGSTTTVLLKWGTLRWPWPIELQQESRMGNKAAISSREQD